MAAKKQKLWREIEKSLLQTPGDWEFGDYRATHHSGITLWTANGGLGLRIPTSSKVKGRIPFWRKLRVMRAVRIAQEVIALDAIQKPKTVD